MTFMYIHICTCSMSACTCLFMQLCLYCDCHDSGADAGEEAAGGSGITHGGDEQGDD